MQPNPPNTMEYELFKLQFGERTREFNLDYDYLRDLADYFLNTQDVWPEAPHLAMFEEFVTLIEKEMLDIKSHDIEPGDLWFYIQNTLRLLGPQLHPVRWIIYSLAWTYVFANHIGDW